mgnify:CR=1 FL=1
MFSYVFLGTKAGRVIKPSNGGLLPKCVTELNTATLGNPSLDFVAIKFVSTSKSESTPLPIIVDLNTALSIVQFAPISTSLAI